MKAFRKFAVAATFLTWPVLSVAEEVELPAPVLEWSFYILLIFAFFVAVGIFFSRGKNGKTEPLSKLINEQSSAVHSVGPGSSVTECVRQMNELRIGAMLVVEDDQLLGIFTERDAMTRVLGAGLDPSSTTVSAVMSDDPVCVTPTTTLDEARAIITNRRVRHLPVVKDGRVMGMVSSGDLNHWLVQVEPESSGVRPGVE